MPQNRGPTLWILIVLSIVLWLGGYVRRGLWEPDEARYAYVAREMQQHDHWFVLHLHGEPYPDKPPLMYWLMNASSVFTGGEINGFSARLPSLLGAIMALWVTAQLMQRWRPNDPSAAWRAIAVLWTSYLFWWQGGWGQIDMLLCGLEMMSLWFFFTAPEKGGARRFALAYLFAGCAVLAKGPVGLAIPLAIYVAVTLVSEGSRPLKRGHWVWGIPLACAIPLAWLWLAYRENPPPEYFAAMFGAKSFRRVIEDHHAQPFFYYLKSFPLDFLPWTVFLPAAYRALEPGPTRRRFVAWALVVIGLFSLSVGKRNLYILAAWPAAAMMIATSWDGLATLTRRWQQTTAWIALGLITLIGLAETGAMVGALTGVLEHAERVIGPSPAAPWLLLPAALLMFVGSSVLIAWFRTNGLTRRWFVVFAGLLFAHWTYVGTFILPAMNPVKAPIEFAAEARRLLRPDQPIHVYRDQLAIIALYAERSGRYLRTPDEVESVVSSGDYGIIVFDEEDWAELAPQFGDRVRARPFEMGSKDLVWVDFPPPVTAEPAAPVVQPIAPAETAPANGPAAPSAPAPN